MKALFGLLLASALAACTSSGTPTQSPTNVPGALMPLTCERAMEEAALDPTENVAVLDRTIEECDTYAEFAAASATYPEAMDGFDPRSFIQERCRDSDELTAEPLCQEVGQPLACDPGFVCEGPLAPGEYSSTSTGAIVTFTLTGEGWSGREDTPGDVPGDGFALFNDAVGGAHGISVVSYLGEVYAQVCSPATIATAATDLIGFLASVDGVVAEDPIPTELGGRPAVRLDLTTESPCPHDPQIGPRMWLWPLPVHGDFHFDDRERVRVYAVDAACVTVAIVIEALPGADYDVLLAKAEEVIDSMTIRPAC
jgi:hypothetical protein